MNEEILSAENIQETTSDALENEEISSSDVSDIENSYLSDSGDTSLSEEDVSADLEEEQSDSDSSAETSENERTFTQSELEEIVTAVLSNDNETYSVETQSETVEVPRTLFNTPLDEFTVSEGLLTCIFLILLAFFINSIFKGSHWFGKL